jgi:WS/DGAT/MGAT family acyltransferase
MHRLSASDSALFDAEPVERPMHVGVVSICAGRPDIERLRATVAARLARVPRFRQVIARVPFDLGRPVWVDDVAFDLGHHVRHIALPAPGDEGRLQEFCNRLAAQPLDPTRPLWELWLVEGLAKRRFAVVGKVHPLLADGIRSPEITDKLFTREPDEPLGTMPEWRAQDRPSAVRLAADGALDAALGLARQSVRAPGRGLLRIGDLRRLAAREPRGPFDTAAACRERQVRWVPLALSELVRSRDASGTTVSEVLLTGITEGVSDWLDARGTPTPEGVLRVLLPLTTSLRAERGALGSRVSGVVSIVPINAMNPRQRLRSISDSVQQAIGVRQPAPAPEIGAIGTFAPPTLMAQAARLQCDSPAFDLSFTNAPGPAEVRYCIGAEVLEVRPIMPLAPGRSLSVAAVSYNGGVSIGLTADPQRIPDLDDLAEAITQGFAELAARRGLRRAA